MNRIVHQSAIAHRVSMDFDPMPPNEVPTTPHAHRRRASERLALDQRGNDEAYGVPRRFGMGTILITMTLFAALLGLLRAVGTWPPLIGVLVTFISLVAVGQMFLYRGIRPRAASVVVGAILIGILFLIGTLIVWMDMGYLPTRFLFSGPFRRTMAKLPVFVGDALAWAAFALSAGAAAAFGALLGYTAGGVVAGVFLVMDYIDALLQWRHDRLVGAGVASREAPPRSESIPRTAEKGTRRAS